MDDALRQKFPDLKPGSRPSALGSVNGFGTTLVGRRDRDAETGTYVTTHCVTALFVPLVPLAAYRVSAAPSGGWYVLGRVPLSRFARGWNLFLLLAALGLGAGLWWDHHSNSPEFAAGRKLDAADAAAKAGQGGQAARLCREVIDGGTARAADGQARLAALVQDPPGDPGQAVEVFAVAADLHRRNRCPVPDLFERGKALAERHAAADPAAALALMEAVAPHATDAAAELAFRRALLERLVALDPADPAKASRLAALYEAGGEREKCRALLAPLEARLGSQDGAAVLGRIYAADDKLDAAFALLGPFVEARLPAFLDADRALTERAKAAQDQAVARLSGGQAPGFDYGAYKGAYKGADEARQSAMVTDYVGAAIREDAGLREARKRMSAQAVVVPAALDLGMVRIRRGQAAADPAVRKRELEAAEKAFLSVRAAAAESDQFKLNLGQVYYWLGRAADGKKQFDALLAARKREAEAVVMVCGALREVGAVGEARALAEEAYAGEKDGEKKFQLARMRANVDIDLDDRILWLSRSNPAEGSVQAALADARGKKSEQVGDDGAATREYRRAVEINEKMAENASTLNNAALAHFSLAQLAHDRAEFARGLDKLDRAIGLMPTDSILLHNAASVVLDNAIRDAAATDLDFHALKATGGWGTLSFLYLAPAERKATYDRVSAHPGLVKARGYSERLLTLAPKRPDAYVALAAIHNHLRDTAGLAAVLDRLREADLDLTDATRRAKEMISGADDEKRRDEYRKGLARVEESLAAARAKGADRTFATAAGRVVAAKVAGQMLGEQADADALVRLAEEAHAAAPSHGSETALTTALLLRGHLALADGNPAYRAAAKKTARSFGSTLVLHALSAGGPTAKAAAGNPDVRRMAGLVLDEYRREPGEATPRMWAALVATHPEDAKECAAKAAANERVRLRRQLDRVLSPLGVGPALEEFWALKMQAGRDADASKVLADLAAKGVPVP